MITLLFFILILLVIYPYGIYPLILIGLSAIRPRKVAPETQTPSISLIISAFNEEAVIRRKLDNTLNLDYPKDRLEIIVASDNSTDKTDEIVRSFSNRGVVLIALPHRQGKTAGLNHAVRRAKGEIIVFSDANAIYERLTLKKMAGVLGDPKIGLVTGTTKYMTQGNGKLIELSHMYTRLEHFIKRLESRLGSCVGADGAVFAIRKSLYQPLTSEDINDFVVPLKVVQQGYRAVLDEDLICTEETSQDQKGEFRRQIRITNRTLRAIFRHTELMNPLKFPVFSFLLISHKIIRFCVPLFLLILFPFNVLLLTWGVIYKLLLMGQVLFYTAAFIGFCDNRVSARTSSFSLFYQFVIVNLSMLVGWGKFLSGQKDVTWNPERG